MTRGSARRAQWLRDATALAVAQRTGLDAWEMSAAVLAQWAERLGLAGGRL